MRVSVGEEEEVDDEEGGVEHQVGAAYQHRACPEGPGENISFLCLSNGQFRALPIKMLIFRF